MTVCGNIEPAGATAAQFAAVRGVKRGTVAERRNRGTRMINTVIRHE